MTKNISCVLVDDETDNNDLLESYLNDYCPFVKVLGKVTTVEEAINLINDVEPQIIFLDIIMGNDSGFDVLKEHDLDNYKIIFVSAFEKFAVKAFRHNATDYIVKPVDIKELISAVDRARNQLLGDMQNNDIDQAPLHIHTPNIKWSNSFLSIPSLETIDFVDSRDILYLKAEDGCTVFYLISGKKIVATKYLSDYESKLDVNTFFKIHRSYIVNLKHVARIHKSEGNYCQLKNGKMLPISKRRQSSLFEFVGVK